MDEARIGMNQLYWIAGLVEGEGCFYFRTRRVISKKSIFRYKYTALITVGMTDADVIYKLAKLWNTSVRLQRRKPVEHKDYYVTTICGKQAIGWMMTLYLLLGARRQGKIRDIIKEWR